MFPIELKQQLPVQVIRLVLETRVELHKKKCFFKYVIIMCKNLVVNYRFIALLSNDIMHICGRISGPTGNNYVTSAT